MKKSFKKNGKQRKRHTKRMLKRNKKYSKNNKNIKGGAQFLLNKNLNDTEEFIEYFYLKHLKTHTLKETNVIQDYTSVSENKIIKNGGNILYVIDMQKDFIDKVYPGLTGPVVGDGNCIGSFSVNNGKDVVGKIITFLKANFDKFDKIVFSRDVHDPNHCSFGTEGGPFPPHCIMGTVGCEFDEDIKTYLESLTPEQQNKIDIIFKGMHRNQDSFGAVKYKNDNARQKRQIGEKCNKEKTDDHFECGTFTGSKKLKNIVLQESINFFNKNEGDIKWEDECKKKLFENYEPINPKENGNIYVCGLAGDWCVRDTVLNLADVKDSAIAGKKAELYPQKNNYNINHNIYVLNSLTRNAFIPCLNMYGYNTYDENTRYGKDFHLQTIDDIKKIDEKGVQDYIFEMNMENFTYKILNKDELNDFSDISQIQTGKYWHFITDHRQIINDYIKSNVIILIEDFEKKYSEIENVNPENTESPLPQELPV